MHEMSLCMSVVESLSAAAKENQYPAIEKVWLEVGPFSGVEIEALRFGFDVSAKGTVLEGATIEIIETQAEAWCFQCETQVLVQERYDDCPRCGSRQLQVVSGEELRIKQIAVKE